MVKNLPADAGDVRNVVSIPGLGRSPRTGSVNPLQYSCLENSRDRGAWWATQSMGSQRQTQLGTCLQSICKDLRGIIWMAQHNFEKIAIKKIFKLMSYFSFNIC